MQYEPGEPEIRGKTVVIVGAAGLRQATAAMLTQYGASVFIAAGSANELSQTLDMVCQAGGVADGMVVDVCRAEDVQHFFEQAEQQMGHIDAVVSYLTMEAAAVGTEAEACQNVVMQEAIRRIGTRPDGQIVYVGPANQRSSAPARNTSARSTAAALRRQATEMGIRVTLIQPGASARGEIAEAEPVLSGEDVARYVLESLAQPFGVDVIFLPGQLEAQP